VTDTERPENESTADGPTEQARSSAESRSERTDSGALRSMRSSSSASTGAAAIVEPTAAEATAADLPDAEPGEPVASDATETDHGGTADVAVPPHYGIGPFSVREITLGIVWVFAFVVSFFHLIGDRSVWTNGLEWILTIGLPTAAMFLLVLRRLSPTGIRRVGSLGIDQFASVVFSVSLLLWLQYIWETVSIAIAGGGWVRSWVMWVEAVLMLGGVVLTVAAKWLPVLGDDFRYREPVVAQPSARPIRDLTPRPVVARPPRAPRPAKVKHDLPVEAILPVADEAAEPANQTTANQTTANQTTAIRTTATEAVHNDAETVAVPVAHQAFWALSPVERDVVDEHGVPLFRIGPTAWALVIEDRGSTFVVRNDDGRVGYLRDVSGVTRG
jgi:hypothetical protein